MYIPFFILAVLFFFYPATAIDLAVLYLAYLFPAIGIPAIIILVLIIICADK